MKVKYLILGAGPAGLAFAHRLKQNGEESFYIIEKECEAGGLCRSKIVDGSPFDIGGGHFLDTRDKGVNDFLFEFMPSSEWNLFERDSRIQLDHVLVAHPLEANIWQLDINEQVEYLKSIAAAGSNTNEPMPDEFVRWIKWKLGEKIANDYMLPYNRKMFGEALDELGTYWLEKLPNVSFEEILLSCLKKKAYGKQPGHAKFFYPQKYGYGELWLRMAREISDHIQYNSCAKAIDFEKKEIRLDSGERFQGNIIITTIPWKEYKQFDEVTQDIEDEVKQLQHTSIYTKYQSENVNTLAHWIYYPDPQLPYHRKLFRQNFATQSKGSWTETNGDRHVTDSDSSCIEFFNEYAYPLNTKRKPLFMRKILDCAKKSQVYGLGRWGEHQHFNSDVTVRRAIDLCDKLICK